MNRVATTPSSSGNSGIAVSTEPTAQERRLLTDLFQAGQYAMLEPTAKGLTERYPDSGYVWHALATAQRKLGKDSLQAWQRAADLLVTDARIQSTLGDVLHKLGRFEDAAASYRRSLALDATSADTHFNLGYTLRSLGQNGEAVQCFQRALEIKPDLKEANFNLGMTLHAMEQLQEAAGCYRREIEINPGFADAYFQLGNALNELAQPSLLEEALAHYRYALKIKPDFSAALINLGAVLRSMERFEEAEQAVRQAVEKKPDLIEAHLNLGNVLGDLGRWEEAVASYRNALAISPNYVDALNNLGVALKELKQLQEATECFRRAVTIAPEDAYPPGQSGFEGAAQSNLGVYLQEMGQINEAMDFLRQSLSLNLTHAHIHSNLLLALQYTELLSPTEVLIEHRAYATKFEAPLSANWQSHTNLIDSQRKLRVGYVSPDFRSHSVAFFFEPVISHHDKHKFEISCYYNSRQNDAVTERIKDHADHWCECSSLSDVELAKRIRADGIDVLVDLAGHTNKNRLLSFANKPAPVQVTWLGYPSTTGLTAIDYRLTDLYADPVGMTEHLNSEALWRLSGPFSCYRPNPVSPPVIDHPPSLDTGYITFGSFNNLAKVNDAVIRLWAQVLTNVPNARLFLKIKAVDTPFIRNQVEARLQGLGIPLDRLILSPHSDDYLNDYNQIDVALDTFPFNGGTTSMDTLWMGVPLITLAGANFISRMGVSILTHVGLPELIAATPEDYVQLAVRTASDPQWLRGLRDQLRQRLRQSALMDEAAFTQNLEAAYRQMWQIYCDKAGSKATCPAAT